MIQIIAIGVAVTTTIVALMVRERAAARLLNNEQSNQVVTFRAMRGVFRQIGAVVGSVVLVALLSLPGTSALYVLGVVVVVLVVWSHLTYVRGLRRLDVPTAYVSAANRARFVTYGGLAIAGLIFYVEAR